MIETECQKLVIDAALFAGGQGLKLNNRFLVGVVDLLVKIPGTEPIWLEAKLEKLAVSTMSKPHHQWELEVTKRQKDFLRDWDRAGMRTGVVSFVQERGGNVRSLRMALHSYSTMESRDWTVRMADHVMVGSATERLPHIVEQLQAFGELVDDLHV